MKGTMTITLINTILCSGFRCTIMMDRYKYLERYCVVTEKAVISFSRSVAAVVAG